MSRHSCRHPTDSPLIPAFEYDILFTKSRKGKENHDGAAFFQSPLHACQDPAGVRGYLQSDLPQDHFRGTASGLSLIHIFLLGEEIQPDADLTAIEALLARCTPREVRLAEKVLRLFLLRGDA